MTGITMEAIDRFTKKYQVDAESGCWLWTGFIRSEGYGNFLKTAKKGHLKNIAAHRWSYEYHVGPIPEGMQLDHLCRVRHCVNPSHLEAVTPKENVNRGLVKGQQWSKGNQNVKGHTWSVGESNNQSKLTEVQVKEIRNDGRTHEVIAKEYGVVRPLVTMVKNRKRWGHVP